MQPISMVGLFCEDIREERTGQDTLIGILPDNLNAIERGSIQGGGPEMTGSALFPKLGFYLRMSFDPNDTPPPQLSVRLVHPDGSQTPLEGWGQEVIQNAFHEARANEMPLAGLVLKLVASPLIIRRSGKLLAIVNVNGVDRVAGALNIILTRSAAIVSEPPA